ncbi:MAG: hypothetical protein RLZZ440_1623 [Planctomycetota bacterium]
MHATHGFVGGAGDLLVELEQLQHFIRVAELGSITRAAVAAGLSQPAVSRAVARLEEELGQPLFERQARRMVLTEAGAAVLGTAREMLLLADNLREQVVDDGVTGRVRVAAIPTIAPYLLPPLLKSFHAAFPQARVVVHEETTDGLLLRLRDGEVDVAILAEPFEGKYLDHERLFEEELLLVTVAGHPLQAKSQVQLADLQDLPFILLGEAHCLTASVVSLCQQTEFHPVSIEQTSQIASIQELVALDHGVSLIPAMARERDTDPARAYRSLAPPRPSRTIVMAWNPYRHRSRLLAAFMDHVRRSVAGSGTGSAGGSERS